MGMCGCAVERLRVYAKAPAGASAPPWYQCRGAESSAAEDAAAFRATAAMEAGVLSGLTQP